VSFLQLINDFESSKKFDSLDFFTLFCSVFLTLWSIVAGKWAQSGL
jgi:hypothetical protein